MCGRYTLTASLGALYQRFGVQQEDLGHAPRYNIAPTQEVLVITNEKTPCAEHMRWGLVPFWAKDTRIGARMINARAESVLTSSAFRRPFQRRRCLVLADGFYEWRKEGKRRVPMFVRLKGQEPFAFAGLWDVWKSPAGEFLRSCTIMTTRANGLVSPIHDRMPAILLPEAEPRWLQHVAPDLDALTGLLAPYPAEGMEAYEVSSLVNSPKNDSPECIRPVS